MKAKMRLALACLVALASVNAWAGAEGHGSGAIVCDSGMSLLDLFEAKASGLTVPVSGRPVDEQVADAIQRLKEINPLFGDRVEQAYEQALVIRDPVPAGQTLAPPKDLDVMLLPSGCHLAGVGLWQDKEWSTPDDDVLIVDEANLAELESTSPTEAAAFWIHEAVFNSLREFYGTDLTSVRTRKIVGLLFSTRQIEPVFGGLPSEELYVCKRGLWGPIDREYTSYLYIQDDETIVLQFGRLPDGDGFMFGKATATIRSRKFVEYVRDPDSIPYGISNNQTSPVMEFADASGERKRAELIAVNSDSRKGILLHGGGTMGMGGLLGNSVWCDPVE
jgi:hypothetical protein